MDETLIRVRNDVNSDYYNNSDIFAREILLNKKRATVPWENSVLAEVHEKLGVLGTPTPKSLEDEDEAAMDDDESTVPEESDEQLESPRSMEKKIQNLDELLGFELELALINAREIK